MYLPPVNVQARPPMAFFPIFPDSHGVYNSHLTFYGVICIIYNNALIMHKLAIITSACFLSILVENTEILNGKNEITAKNVNARKLSHPNYIPVLF